MLKRYKIHCENGIYNQIKFFGIPLFQFQLSETRKIKNITFPKLYKQKIDKPVFYLKINSKNYKYSLYCLQFWIDIANEMGYDYYIICDSCEIEKKLLNSIIFKDPNVKIIKSDRKTYKSQIKNICVKSWRNPAFSHLTTYTHAKKYGIKEFWNIDADDTCFFEKPETIANIFKNVEQYARENNIHAFSLDMHRSTFRGLHWTFGVTFTQMNLDINNIINHVKNNKWAEVYYKYVLDDTNNANLDAYFTYLSDKNKLNIKTFNIDNLYFIHWGLCTISDIYRFLQIEKDGYLYFPIAEKIEEKKSRIKTYEDVINFNFGIDEQISRQIMSEELFKHSDKLEFLSERFKDYTIRREYENFK